MPPVYRLEALSLADAIRGCMARKAIDERQKARLELALTLARIGSKSVDTGADLVDGVKAELCAVCRSEPLYVCDRGVGWSNDCSLLKANLVR